MRSVVSMYSLRTCGGVGCVGSSPPSSLSGGGSGDFLLFLLKVLIDESWCGGIALLSPVPIIPEAVVVGSPVRTVLISLGDFGKAIVEVDIIRAFPRMMFVVLLRAAHVGCGTSRIPCVVRVL